MTVRLWDHRLRLVWNVYLFVSPHRSSLTNTKEDNITKVKHMRSFIGLYKMLHIGTPAMSPYTVQGLQLSDP